MLHDMSDLNEARRCGGISVDVHATKEKYTAKVQIDAEEEFTPR